VAPPKLTEKAGGSLKRVLLSGIFSLQAATVGTQKMVTVDETMTGNGIFTIQYIKKDISR
jgi:hypothetical protein